MKAKLVIEMPKGCNDCQLATVIYHFGNIYYCPVADPKTAKRGTVLSSFRPSWCPLIEVNDE